MFADQVEVVVFDIREQVSNYWTRIKLCFDSPFSLWKRKIAFSRRRNLRYGRNLAFSRRRDVRFCKKVALYKSRNIRYGKKEVFLGDAISDVGSDHSVATKQIW